MKKFLIVPILAIGLTLSACAKTTADMTPEQIAAEEARAAEKRQLVVELAIQRIDAFNAMGVDPIQLEPVYLLALDTACVTIQAFGIEVGLTDDTIKNVGVACTAIQKAAAKGTTTPVEEVPPS